MDELGLHRSESHSVGDEIKATDGLMINILDSRVDIDWSALLAMQIGYGSAKAAGLSSFGVANSVSSLLNLLAKRGLNPRYSYSLILLDNEVFDHSSISEYAAFFGIPPSTVTIFDKLPSFGYADQPHFRAWLLSVFLRFVRKSMANDCISERCLVEFMALDIQQVVDLAASCVPVVRWPGRSYRRTFPSLETSVPSPFVVATDFVGYTRKRICHGTSVGRGLFEQLQAAFASSPQAHAHVNTIDVLESIYLTRVEQQLELETVACTLKGVALEFGGVSLDLGIDGGIGNDGPLAILPKGGVDSYMRAVADILSSLDIAFVSTNAGPLCESAFHRADRDLELLKQKYSV